MLMRATIVASMLVAMLVAMLWEYRASGAAASADATAATVASANVSVVIDGKTATLDREPVRVQGRFFVPVREIFEALGAKVHVRADEVTATALSATPPVHAYAIVLHVGNPTATIDGTAQTLPEPPVLIAGTVYVPLRFVSAALGARVRYDGATHEIFIDSPSVAQAVSPSQNPIPERTVAPVAETASPVPEPTPTPLATPTPIELPTAAIVLRLVREEPARGTTVARDRPEISASFGEPVAAASVRVLLDGREITGEATITNRYFSYEPSADLAPGAHEIAVAGRTPLHEAFGDRWSFVSAAPTGRNYLSGIEPPSGSVVTSPLTIGGITRPRSRIGLVATSSETAAHFSELAGGSFSDHTVADAKGNFEITLDLIDTGSGFLDVRVDSRAPDGAVAVKTLRLRL